MSDPAITVQQLTKSFGAHRVLDEVSFTVLRGETFALLGPNGAGKTTTIQILLGLLKPDAGEVRVAGYDPQVDPIPLRRNVGYLAEDQTMYGWMTPTELCRFLRPFYPTWDTALADKLLDGFEVPRSARIENLSKGQSVRLGLALALAHRPPVAILDDPALGLDPIARKQFSRDLVEHLQSGGSTVLYSSHLLHEVEAVADTIAILHGGHIVRQESTDELRRQVRQITLEADALAALEPPPSLLDLRIDGSRAIVTLAEAPAFIEQMQAEGIAHEASELSLDEIFEAYVIGRTTGWPQADRAAKVGVSST